MKKYICILFSILCLLSCEEDETVDITVMPAITNSGENSFGCLVDGWLYVGGRYSYYEYGDRWDSIRFWYDLENKELPVSVLVKRDISISFTILSPEEGKECAITEVRFGTEELEDGTVFISRFDQKAKIISGTFANDGRLTNGRFDVHYSELKHP